MQADLFIRKICHDLRAPVRALTELPQWLTEDLADQVDGWPEDARETLDMMQTQAARLDALIDGLSSFVKLTRTAAEPSSRVSDVLTRLELPDTATVRLTLDDFPIEAEHLDLVVTHLVSNVMKHGMGDSRPFTLETLHSKTVCAIRLSDNGPGIEEKFRKKVFEPLATLKPRDHCEGSGFGLSVIERIGQLYGGGCKVDQKDGFEGASVTFFVPRQVIPLAQGRPA